MGIPFDEALVTTPSADPRLLDTRGILGHPRGLMVLFFVEMWERFSFYGMRALLILYMMAPLEQGGLGYGLGQAAKIYGLYTFSVYLFSIPGGWLADRYMGYRGAIFIGGLILAAGHFSMAFHSLECFYGGLALIVLGTGLLKTNSATLVGELYGVNDARRDAGFSIYYMGINLGGLVAPLVCGFLAQDPRFIAFLSRMGLATESGWHWGFTAAGVAMLCGLVQFALQQNKLGQAGLRPKVGPQAGAVPGRMDKGPLTREEWRRIGVVGILFIFSVIFWAVFEQAGSTLNLFADRYTQCKFMGYAFPSSWLQSVNSVWIFLLAPPIAMLWVRLGKREPSSATKFAAAVFLVGLGMLLLVPVSLGIERTPGTLAGPGWLVGVFLLHTLGELCLSPVGLSLTTKLAPPRIAGMMMGLWMGSIAVGNLLAGYSARLFLSLSLAHCFLLIFGITTVASLVLLGLKPYIRNLMGTTR